MRKSNPKSYEYIENLLSIENQAMLTARENSKKLGLEAISISQTEAALIKFFLKEIKPQKILEIGTLTGLSALHLLEVMPEKALLLTLEKSEKHGALAHEVLKDEIQKGRCRIIIGDAQLKLAELKNEAPFDAIFIDGNKAAYLEYFNWACEHLKLNGLIFVDNVFLAGAVWGGETMQNFNSKQIQAVRSMNEKAFQSQQLSSVIIPTEEGLLITKKIN